jgi:hypothetical protein
MRDARCAMRDARCAMRDARCAMRDARWETKRISYPISGIPHLVSRISYPVSRGRRPLLPLLLAAVLAVGVGSGAAAAAKPHHRHRHRQQDPPARPPVPLVLVVPVARDAGGLPPAREGDPLNARVSEALREYLSRTAAERFVVSEKPVPGEVRLTLEGELSHVARADTTGGPYLWTARLYREPHRLVGQWAGSAESLRYLTGNLRQDPRVDLEGLVGELGKRVVAATVAAAGEAANREFARLVDQAASHARVEAQVVPEAGAGAGEGVVSGGRYRVRVSSQDAGSAFLLEVGEGGRPRALFAPEAGQEVAAGRAALLPPGEPLAAGEVTALAERDLVVLIRRHVEHPARSLGDISLSAADTASSDDEDAPVRVLGSTELPERPTLDPAVARLLTLARADPAGTWLARRVKLRVLPK